jgi:hypothetical protein
MFPARMSALSHRHHGGNRLHCAANGLPADSQHIMTPNLRSDQAMANLPRDRDGEARVARIFGPPEREPNGQFQAGLIICPRGSRKQQRPNRRRGVRMMQSPERWLASTPIALATGEPA